MSRDTNVSCFSDSCEFMTCDPDSEFCTSGKCKCKGPRYFNNPNFGKPDEPRCKGKLKLSYNKSKL